ncbi:MAG: hypothetical protein J6T01_06555 [Kiritimatiellae bacterium]|nr:hypothetical protein [Kiritimatiellia bacterium]
MKKTTLAAALAALTALAAEGAFTHLEIDDSSLPAENRVVAHAFAKRVSERSRPVETNGFFKVSFRVDPSLGGENARVVVSADGAEVTGARVRALYYGAGKLLSSIDYRADGFSVSPRTVEVKPVKSVRIAYWARHFHNWYHMAPASELKEYAEDMMFMGVNAFDYQYGFPQVNLAGATKDDVLFFTRNSKALYDHIVAMDADFVSGGGGNQVPQDSPEEYRAVPEKDPARGNLGFNACPAKPKALEYMLDLRRKAIEKWRADGVKPDYFVHWPFDEGGCECDACKPWGGNGFISLCKKFAAMNKAYSPGAKTVLSLWVYHDDEYKMLWDYLAKPESAWIDGLMIDAHEDFPKFPLARKPPREIPVITFPEISMWKRSQWGGSGATAMPARFERLFRQVEKIASGFMFYSEGIFEDVNKAVVTGLYVDPSRNWPSIVGEYGRYHFPGVKETDFVRFIAMLEDQHVLPGNQWRMNFFAETPRAELDDYTEKTRRSVALARRLEEEMIPTVRKSWRWRLLRLRAEIDAEMFASRDVLSPKIVAYYRELIRLYRAEPEEGDYEDYTNHVWCRPYLPAVRLKGRPGETVSFRYVRRNRTDKPIDVTPEIKWLPEGFKARTGVVWPNGAVRWGESMHLESGKSGIIAGEVTIPPSAKPGHYGRIIFSKRWLCVDVSK